MKVRRKTNRSVGITARGGILGVVAAAAVLLCAVAPGKAAQLMNNFGGPSLSVGPRISVNPHIDIRPNIHYSPNVTYQDPTGRGGQPRVTRKRTPSDSDPPRKTTKRSTPVIADNTYVPKEVLIEIAGDPGEDQVRALSRRFHLTRVQSQTLPTMNATFLRWRIADDRSVDDVVRELNASGAVSSAQRNSIFRLQETPAASHASPAGQEGAMPQYALASLHLPEAHTLSRGAGVRIAVIDSAIDVHHPELSGAIESSFDALGGDEGAHAHGTSIAGVIASHQRLTGSAPMARLIAIRAFGAQKSGAESNSFVILKSLDYAIAHGAQIINMSFAGPQDAAISRALGIAATKGIVLVAAAGNAGPKSPPLYPGADSNVIAVTATDSSDRLFDAANHGGYIALAAPGVDILTPLPDGKYGVSSGTSLSAAYVSGLAALMIARDPKLAPAELRAMLTGSARDLGPKGRDDEFGAGEADAFAAVAMVAGPIETASRRPNTP
jgi:subtilisin family serine protease